MTRMGQLLKMPRLLKFRKKENVTRQKTKTSAASTSTRPRPFSRPKISSTKCSSERGSRPGKRKKREKRRRQRNERIMQRLEIHDFLNVERISSNIVFGS